MAKIPGLPTLDPVALPSESPGEAGKPGQAIAQLGAEANDTALTGLDFDLFLKKAQQHVDSLAAQNDLAKVYADTQNQLAKTQNSRDVDGVIQDSRKALNDVSARWSKSPAAVDIQMSADALRPDLSRIGTERQVDLMGKEFKVTIDQQAEALAASYAADRGSGGSGDMALGAFSTAVYGGVKTGLVGDVEANEMVRQFKQNGQELQIKNGITNANPDVNQKIYDQITAHREDFPDVTQEALDTYKGQALSAFEAHTKFQDWEQGQMALMTQLLPKIQQFTNPATGRFDEAAALNDNADRMAKGEITETQSTVLAQGFASHATQLNVQLKQQAEKTKNSVVELFHKNEYTQASAVLAQHKDDPEFGEYYEGLTKYGDQVQRERRAEGREEFTLERQLQAEQSSEVLGNVLSALSQGHTFTDAQLYGMAGAGKGKMKSADVMEAIRASKAYESDPNTQAAVKLMNDSFPLTTLPRTATAQQVAAAADPNARQIKRMALTYQQWQARVNANPNEDKVAAMKDVLQPAIQEQIGEQINAIFGVPTPKKSTMERAKESFDGLFLSDAEKAARDKGQAPKSPPIIQHSPSTGKDRYSTDGGKTWQPGKPPQ